jgi:hypothetical protein
MRILFAIVLLHLLSSLGYVAAQVSDYKDVVVEAVRNDGTIAVETNRAILEMRKAYHKKLLEFVLPQTQNTVLRDSLTTSLLTAAQSNDPKFAEIAADFQSASIATLRHERQLQSMEFINRVKNDTGITVALRARAISTEINAALLGLQKESARIAAERRQLRAQGRMDYARNGPIDPLSAATGNRHNILLGSLKGQVFEYGYSASEGTPLGLAISQLTLTDEDLSRIRLKTLTEGGYIDFNLLEGSGALAAPPFILRRSTLQPQLAEVESKLKRLGMLDSRSDTFVTETIELRAAVDNLYDAFLEELGSPQAAAQKGNQYYSQWRKARDYFTGLIATVNCLEIENSNRIVQNRFQYDPKQFGNGVLALATFVATNNCEFAPAAAGDEGSYVRLLRRLLELQALLIDESLLSSAPSK